MSIRFRWEFAFADTDTVQQIEIPNWVGQRIAFVLKFSAYDTTNNRTRTVEVLDPDGEAIYTKADFADAVVTVDDTKKIPLVQGGVIRVTMNVGAPGNAGIDTAVLYAA
jgi:hypothetical protein